MKNISLGACGAGCFACWFCSAGCATKAGVSSGELGAVEERLVRAEPSPLGGREDAVVLLRTVTDKEQVCSGTLVAPNLVLTSRHCVARATIAPFACTVQGELIDNPGGGGQLGADAPAQAIEIYGARTPRVQPIARGSAVVSSLSTNVCKDDIAFVVLDRALELPWAPVRIRLQTRRGELALLVGYGSDGTSSDLPWPDVQRRHLLEQAVLDVGPDSIEQGVITARPRILVFGGPSSCYGDSGGPALSETTGAVMAVLSVIDRQDCLDENVKLHYTQTSTFEDLALRAFEAAGAEPRFEDDRALGEACSENHQCVSARCLLRSEEPPVCTQSCEVAPCAEGYQCVALGEEALCAPKPATPCANCGPVPVPPDESGCSVQSRGTSGAAETGLLMLAALGAARRRRAFRKSSALSLACAALLGLMFGVSACGEDEVVLGMDGVARAGSSGTGAGSSGASGSGGVSGTGGATDSGAGRGGSAASDAGDASGGSSGEASAGSSGSGGDGSTDSSTEGSTDAPRCLPAGSAYTLDVCRRLTSSQQLSIMNQLLPEYAGRLRTDCRISALIDRHNPFFEYLNALLDWGFAFWGCRTEGVKTFGLAGTVTALSAADVRVLSEHYLELAELRLSLSTREAAEMREALECLGARAVSNPSTTVHELSKCVADSGVDSSADGGADSSADTGSDAETDDGGTDSATE